MFEVTRLTLTVLLSVLIPIFIPGWLLARFLRVGPATLFAVVASPLLIYLFVTMVTWIGIDLSRWGWIAATLLCIGATAALVFRQPPSDSFSLTDAQAKAAFPLLLLLASGPGTAWRTSNFLFTSDALGSWNRWAQSWAHGVIPSHAYGYPQLIPTVWSVPYWFFNEEGQFTAHVIFLLLLVSPPFVAALHVARRMPVMTVLLVEALALPYQTVLSVWLQASIRGGFPDWVGISFLAAGFLLLAPFLSKAEKELDHLEACLALACFTIATSIKLVCGVYALMFLFIAASHYVPRKSYRTLSLLCLIFVAAVITYLIYYVHIANLTLPPVAGPQNLQQGFDTFYLRMRQAFSPYWLIVGGIYLSLLVSLLNIYTFALAVASLIGIAIWIAGASYDVRAGLPFIFTMIAIIPLALYRPGMLLAGILRTSAMPRGIYGLFAVAGLALLGCFVFVPTFISPVELKSKFNEAELAEVGGSRDLNFWIRDQLRLGCKVATTNGYMSLITQFNSTSLKAAQPPTLVPVLAKWVEQPGCVVAVIRPTDQTPDMTAAVTQLLASGATEEAVLVGWRRIVRRPGV